jgi:nucleotide-binding universal stress UspA family protein
MILVPTDFTEVGYCALNHAITLATTLETNIGLLHIVEKETEKTSAVKKLNDIIEKAKTKIAIEPIVEVGNIFDDIGKVASNKNAIFIIMGTHGIKGFQHITGSYALKVITNSVVPFIVVQKREIRKGYFKIVCPLDLSQDTKQKLSLTTTIAQYFKAKVFLCCPHQTDEFFINTINRNLQFAKNNFDVNQIEYEAKIFEEKGNFPKQTLDFANSIDADLISIINQQEQGVHEYIAGTEERTFITNTAQIPVMCINPVSVSREGSALFFK